MPQKRLIEWLSIVQIENNESSNYFLLSCLITIIMYGVGLNRVCNHIKFSFFQSVWITTLSVFGNFDFNHPANAINMRLRIRVNYTLCYEIGLCHY